MHILLFLLIVLSLLYVLLIFVMLVGLERDKKRQTVLRRKRPFVSIVIVARNEEQNIRNCLISTTRQHYPKEQMEVIVVDDGSSDKTADIVREFAQEDGRVHLISFENSVGNISPKKRGVEAGMAISQGDIILTTDADCVAPNTWIETVTNYFDHDIGAAASWVLVEDRGTLLGKIEKLDTLSLQMVGASAIAWNRPILANGANFAYRRDIFQESKGFQDINKYASGDDDLLIQKFSNHWHYRIGFNQEKDAAVRTGVNKTWLTFLQQRIRWASKGAAYAIWLQLFELYIYSYFLLLLFFSFLSLFNLSFLYYVAVAWIAKMGSDYIFIKRGCRKVSINPRIHIFVMTEFVQIFYVLIAGAWGRIGRFTWKGREYKRGKISRNV